MVEFSTVLQFIQAAGIIIGVSYYVLTLHETAINRKIALTNSLMAPIFFTEEGMQSSIELMLAEWSDYEDFLKKYDSHVNPKFAAKRLSIWNLYDNIGHQYKMGLLDVETVYSVCSIHATNMWIKYEPIIEEYRKTDYGRDAYLDFEYLAQEMAKIKAKKDASWRGSATYIKPDEYDRTIKG